MYKIYKVKSGDTLESIARKFNTSVDNIRDINGIDYISLGQMIIVPNNTSGEWFEIYTIKKGDNLYSLADKFNISLVDLLNINGLDKDNYIYPGQEILVPKNDVSVIITRKEETLESACTRLGLDNKSLLEQNNNLYLMPEQLLINKR